MEFSVALRPIPEILPMGMKVSFFKELIKSRFFFLEIQGYYFNFIGFELMVFGVVVLVLRDQIKLIQKRLILF